MSSNKAKKYTSEFKNQAVNLAHRVAAYQASRELGISTSTLYKWLKSISENTSHVAVAPDGATFQYLEEINNFKKELARDKEVRVSKKATSFFANLEK